MRTMYTAQDAAKMLNISEKSVYYRISTGKLLARRMGARWLIPSEEIARLLAESFSGGDAYGKKTP